MSFPSLAFLALAAPAGMAAQVSVAEPDTVAVTADAGDALGAARVLQAEFERRRQRYFPRTAGGASGPCDEVVGRMCTWHGEGEWYPEPEAEEVRVLRAELLAGLDSIQELIPASEWVLGQRVWYRAEGGDWEGALGVARACGRNPPWWCAALEGLALHGLQHYSEAEGAFERSLAGMDPETALEWRVPERAVDSDGRRVLEGLVTADDGSLEVVLDRLWSLADPLYLVEGNDRLTAHYARWTVARLKDQSRNPYRLRWGRDLEELTVRHGWEIGWERAWTPRAGQPDDVTGHKDPEGRDFLPSGRAFADPTLAAAEDLVADRRRPRSLYAPAYAPVLLPMEGQLSLFPRGDRLLIVAMLSLPEDTTFHARHDHPKPWMEPGDQAGLPDRIGLFAVPVDGGSTVGTQRAGSVEGALFVEVPAGAWLVSAESWSPGRRRAGRYRTVIDRAVLPPEADALSDLLLLAPSVDVPTSIEDALSHLLRAPEIACGDGLAIAWETWGLDPGGRQFEVTVARADRGIFRRIGEALRLASRPAPVSLAWEDPGSERPGAQFHHLDLSLPCLDTGRWEVVLTLRSERGSEAVTRRAFIVR